MLNIQFMAITDFQLLSLVGLFEKHEVLLSILTKKKNYLLDITLLSEIPDLKIYCIDLEQHLPLIVPFNLRH